VTAAVAAAGLLAGCTGGARGWAGAPAGGVSPVASTAPASAAPAGADPAAADLARGLLPADAFGAGATVVPVSLAELRQRLAAVPGGLGSALAGVHVDPEPCAAALQAAGADLLGVTGLAGEGARTGSGVTAEALVTGAPVASAVGSLGTLADACGTAEVTSPHGTATVGLTRVDLAAAGAPHLGDEAVAVAVTAVLTPAERAPVTVTGLVAAVRDGDRLLLLGTAAPGATPADRTAFASLLQRAYDTESDAFG
jgi:hypothetical protein